jgi:hypothetical protein
VRSLDIDEIIYGSRADVIHDVTSQTAAKAELQLRRSNQSAYSRKVGIRIFLKVYIQVSLGNPFKETF